MVVGAKVCELTDAFLWFVCGNFDVYPYHSQYHMLNMRKGYVAFNYDF